MKATALAFACWAAGAIAAYDGNLNYRSPSLVDHHAGLGIDLPKVKGRMLKKRDAEYEIENLNFTHGIASVHTSLRAANHG